MRDTLATLRARLLRARPQPPRPRLCPGVKPRGPMTESGFAIQPWLVERNGRFIQLTELLYRIAERADGTRSVAQIAADCAIPVDAARQLLTTRLVPAGIVTTERDDDSRSSSVAATARSPLALNVRMAVVPRDVIDALTRIFQYLYAPPLLVLLLFLTLQAQHWLLIVHGVNAGITQAVSPPASILLVVALMIASAAFHELGHAAALRYSGGTVRGMGFGFYLMYPALYTDVSDNYRLGRWARVRTDLGGFYFNLLFSLGLMGVYHVTGQDCLLLVALLTNIEILHQCLPFVRLDGYWALADLTGIPDFLSFMGAYVRSVLPSGHWNGRKLPRLKWWAKAVFAAYIAVCVPVMLLLVMVMVSAAPRVMTTAWQAARQQVADVAAAQAIGDLVGIGVAELQLVLLLLPALGVAIMLLSLARTLALVLWRWGRPTRARRFASAAVAACGVAALVYVWSPPARLAIAASVRPPGRTVPTADSVAAAVAGSAVASVTAPTDTPAASALATDASAASAPATDAPAATAPPTDALAAETPAPTTTAVPPAIATAATVSSASASAGASPTRASVTAARPEPSEPSATAVLTRPPATPGPARGQPPPARASAAPAAAVPRPSEPPAAAVPRPSEPPAAAVPRPSEPPAAAVPRPSEPPAAVVPRPSLAPTADTAPDQAEAIATAAAPTASAAAVTSARATPGAASVVSASATPRAAPVATPSAATAVTAPGASPRPATAVSPAPSPFSPRP